MPHTSSIAFGPTPAPTHAAPATGFEEVTNGYVPWSMSSIVPCAPSKTTVPPALERLVAEQRRVGDVRLEPVAVGDVLLGHRVKVERRVLRVRAQRVALGLERGHDLLAQDRLVEQVLDADAEARRLVRVAGADAAPGGADAQLAQPGLAGAVEQHVVGHDQVRVGRDLQAADVDAAPLQALDLAEQHPRVDHHAVADRAQLARDRGCPRGSGGT